MSYFAAPCVFNNLQGGTLIFETFFPRPCFFNNLLGYPVSELSTKFRGVMSTFGFFKRRGAEKLQGGAGVISASVAGWGRAFIASLGYNFRPKLSRDKVSGVPTFS